MLKISKTSIALLLVGLLQTIGCSGTLIPVETDTIPSMEKPFPSNQDVYDLQAAKYRNLIHGNDYTNAITQAIKEASVTGGGIILFPGNTTVEISSGITMNNNISFTSSEGIATIKCSQNFSGRQMVVIASKKQLFFNNIRFDGNGKANGIASYGKANDSITISHCEFINFKDNTYYRRGTGITFQNTSNVHIDHCVFKESDFGIRFDKNNCDLYIEDNTFENSLLKNPIRIQGNAITSPEDQRAYSENIWIRNNTITIGRADSIIEELDILTRDPETGAVDISLVNGKTDPDYKTYTAWRKGRFGPSGIYLTCGNKENEDNQNLVINRHLNVVIEGNVIDGPDYGFFDGGTADLYSLKDIQNLRCVNNSAYNSGDLGFSIERSKDVIVSNNTANRNNSFGIAFTYVENGLLSNNVCKNNALRRNLIYNNTPYGGILIAGSSMNTTIKDNYLESDEIAEISKTLKYSNVSYYKRNHPSDFYGIVVKAHTFRKEGKIVKKIPSLTTIEANQFKGFKWGAIYNLSASTQIKDCFSSDQIPMHSDYPLHTTVLNSDAANGVDGWKLIHRLESKLGADWDGKNSRIKLATSNNTVQDGDIIGIALDNGHVYWTEVHDTKGSRYIELEDHIALNLASLGNKIIVLRWESQKE